MEYQNKAVELPNLRNSINCQFLVKKFIYWDYWGKSLLFATPGEILNGKLILPFNPSRPQEFAIIESKVYTGVSDFASSEEVELWRVCSGILSQIS